MYKFFFEDKKRQLALRQMVEVFLPASRYELVDLAGQADLIVPYQRSLNEEKKVIYEFLKKETGLEAAWGTWTGVRPLKYFEQHGEEYFRKELLVDEEKISLLKEVMAVQDSEFGRPEEDSVSIYIGIPFCPSRCLYCSFTSNQAEDEEIIRYLGALEKEILAVGDLLKARGLYAETIYIGGGTPTSIGARELDLLCKSIKSSLVGEKTIEWTLEAGRPDTINQEKLNLVAGYGVDRLSINPQTLKEDSLELIGRQHSKADFYRAFEIAARMGDFAINCDLIAGLPGEDEGDFAGSLKEVIELSPENITIHNLAVKRASRLKEVDRDFHHRGRQLAINMMNLAKSKLAEAAYLPYYIYRQKHMRGDGENIGFTKKQAACLYNIRTMDERQTVVALGAGGISKKYLPKTDRIERVANVIGYDFYIDRVEEMIKRKQDKLF